MAGKARNGTGNGKMYVQNVRRGNMNKLINQCSLKDTTILRNLILENPELPLIIFCGEGVWNGEHPYNQVDASKGEIEELTLYGDMWLNKEDYEADYDAVVDVADEELPF